MSPVLAVLWWYYMYYVQFVWLSNDVRFDSAKLVGANKEIEAWSGEAVRIPIALQKCMQYRKGIIIIEFTYNTVPTQWVLSAILKCYMERLTLQIPRVLLRSVRFDNQTGDSWTISAKSVIFIPVSHQTDFTLENADKWDLPLNANNSKVSYPFEPWAWRQSVSASQVGQILLQVAFART